MVQLPRPSSPEYSGSDRVRPEILAAVGWRCCNPCNSVPGLDVLAASTDRAADEGLHEIAQNVLQILTKLVSPRIVALSRLSRASGGVVAAVWVDPVREDVGVSAVSDLVGDVLEPRAVGAPVGGDGLQRGLGRVWAEVVDGGHGAVQPFLLDGEDVGVAGAAQQDQLGGKGADAGQCLQVCQ